MLTENEIIVGLSTIIVFGVGAQWIGRSPTDDALRISYGPVMADHRVKRPGTFDAPVCARAKLVPSRRCAGKA